MFKLVVRVMLEV